MSVYETLAALEQQLRDNIAALARNQGNSKVLQDIRERFGDYADALAACLPEVRQLEQDTAGDVNVYMVKQWRERAEQAEVTVRRLEQDLVDGVELFRILQRQRDELQEKLDKAELQLRGLTIPMETAKLLSRAEEAEADVLRLRQELEFQRARADKWVAVTEKRDAELEQLRTRLAALKEKYRVAPSLSIHEANYHPTESRKHDDMLLQAKLEKRFADELVAALDTPPEQKK